MRTVNRVLILAAAGTGWGVVLHAADPTPATTRPAATRAAAAAAAATGPTTSATVASASATTSPATTAPTAPAVPDERIEAAIRKLSAATWKERQAAQDTLVRFGEQAIARLRELDRSDDDEVRTRAAAALWQIEQNAQLGGSTVTIKVKDAKPKDVFAEIGRQARCDFPTYPPNLWEQNKAGVTLTMDLERAPFWTAFREACKGSGVFPQQMGTDRRMTLSQSHGMSNYWNGPSVIHGPFMIVAHRIHRSDSIDLANPGTVQRDFYLNLAAFVEPKVRVIQSSYNVRLDEAVDDKGNSLVEPRNNANFAGGMSSGQQWMWNLTAKLSYPENPGKTIARVRGGMRFVVQTKAETLDIPDVLGAKNVTKTVAGRRVLLKEVKRNPGDTFEVQMTLFRDALGQQEWNAMSSPGYAVRLLDASGRALASRGWGGGGGGAQMNYNWTFARDNFGNAADRAGEPHRLVWEIATETREMNVDFGFKDLPMP